MEVPLPSTASGADRISALPDGVREHVLSLLPAHEAVRTSLLSRSWRGLWMRSPALRITAWGTADRFRKFVRRLLRLRLGGGGARLVSCDFDLTKWHCHFEEEEMIAVHERLESVWIRRVVRSKVEVLRVCLCSKVCDLILTPPNLPVSKHLKEVELTSIDGLYGNSENVLDFTGCPALQKLKIDGCLVFAETVLSLSLNYLFMIDCGFSEHKRTLITVPSLISLELNGFSGRTPLLDDIPSLMTAYIRFHDGCSDVCSTRDFVDCLDGFDDCGESDCYGCHHYYGTPSARGFGVLLDALSKATHLRLSACLDMYVFNRDLAWCPPFGKLKTLVLIDWFVTANFTGLAWFLKQSPILERLILQFSEVPESSSKHYNSSELSISVASKHLNHVEIKCEEVDGMVLVILKILRASGISLEKIHVQCSNGRYGCFNFVCTGFSSM